MDAVKIEISATLASASETAQSATNLMFSMRGLPSESQVRVRAFGPCVGAEADIIRPWEMPVRPKVIDVLGEFAARERGCALFRHTAIPRGLCANILWSDCGLKRRAWGGAALN